MTSMRPVIYSMSVSLDGFIAGPGGDISWSPPDEERFRFHVEQTREIGVELMGRGLYESMLVWGRPEAPRSSADELEFARIWNAIPKVVFSTTLERVEGNARLAGTDVASEVARLREEPGEGVVSVGGAGLASTLIKANLIDEYRLFVDPVVLGGGTSYFSPLEAAIELELLETRTFGSRVVYLRYRRG
jgi:dihydrofolate reductase